jgi:hypothetical protein
MSQKRRDLDIVARHSGLDDFLLRPLSAKRLDPTWPERMGLVDRSRLCAFTGRGRRGLIQLAQSLGLSQIPGASAGCPLTNHGFARKVRDLIRFCPGSRSWDFELLRIGRHFRHDEHTKIVVARNAEEGDTLRSMFRRADAPAAALLEPVGFGGPTTLVVGPAGEEPFQAAGRLLVRYTRNGRDAPKAVRLRCGGESRMLWVPAGDVAETAVNVVL